MIVRHGSRSRWTVLDNGLLDDARLSFRAKGVAAYLLSKPDGWKPNREALAKVGPDGVRAVRSAMSELSAAGYLEHDRSRDDQGKWTTTVTIFECPPEARNAPPVPPAETREEAGRTEGAVSAVGNRAGIASTGGTSTEEPLGSLFEKADGSPPPPKAPRARDPLWDAIAYACELPLETSELTRGALGMLRVAVADIRRVGGTPDQVYERAAAYKVRYRSIAITPTALAKWWPQLGGTSADPVSEGDEMRDHL